MTTITGRHAEYLPLFFEGSEPFPPKLRGRHYKLRKTADGAELAIGCSAKDRRGDGHWESFGQPVEPRSLCLKQLEDRMGATALKAIQPRRR